MIVRETWAHALHTRMNCYAVGKLFPFCGQPIKSDHVFLNMSLHHVHVFGFPFFFMFLLVPG